MVQLWPCCGLSVVCVSILFWCLWEVWDNGCCWSSNVTPLTSSLPTATDIKCIALEHFPQLLNIIASWPLDWVNSQNQGKPSIAPWPPLQYLQLICECTLSLPCFLWLIIEIPYQGTDYFTRLESKTEIVYQSLKGLLTYLHFATFCFLSF